MSKVIKSVRVSGEHYKGALMVHDDGFIMVSVKATPGREREVQEYIVNGLMNGFAAYLDRTPDPTTTSLTILCQGGEA